ncbi:FMN-binding negative transcriptional regulator [Parvularcula sp. LCG005]|uniref:FMN-binding negative transcriptional regulator n=1 Tax=Parvularcula sp. LCG005 TaxID=3078805 RepID=UPI002943C7BA|nr:FMN-binding negative transcriptional regulator [Parvularcula sp. LCG005]WOI52467.1 FMN-binding negative transcriptional regulator [Parvularcula sp. LCG005]
MAYPPLPYRPKDERFIASIVREHPFATLFTAGGGLHATRLPVLVDMEEGQPLRLRAHVNARNPQAGLLDGGDVLVSFTGPHTYVSPHWRADKGRGGTWNFTGVNIRGTARLRPEPDFFRALVNDLSALVEPQYAEIGDYPVWTDAMAPDGYIERLLPQLTAFEVDVTAVEPVAMLHQDYSAEDRRSVVDHLSRSSREGARAIAEMIRTDDEQ